MLDIYVILYIYIYFNLHLFFQRKVQKENTNIPGELIGIISKETFDKARLYAIDKRNYEMVRDIITVTFSLTFLSCNGMYLIWELGGKYITYFGYEPNESNEIIQSAAFSIVLNFVNNIVGLPLSVYYTFVLEERHGFNKQVLYYLHHIIQKSANKFKLLLT